MDKLGAPCISNITASVRGPKCRAGKLSSSDQQCCVIYLFFSQNHAGELVCVWDAGMHGANPPLSSNAWTVSKTLLLLLLPSMLIRCGLGWGWGVGWGGMGGCTDVIQGWHHKVQNAPIVRDDICCAHLGLCFKVSTDKHGQMTISNEATQINDDFRWSFIIECDVLEIRWFS